MTPAIAAHRSSSELCSRLERRRGEIEQTILARVHAIEDPTAAGDPEYVTGLRSAVSAAVRHWLTVIERGRATSPSVPAELLSQARDAARFGVPLETVLRRYVAGYALLGDFVLREAETAVVDRGELQRLTHLQAETFDELIDAISAEYELGRRSRQRTLARRRADTVIRLLAGELVDVSELGYELEIWHIAIAAMGRGTEGAIRAHAASLDLRPLIVSPDEGMTWAWLGSERAPDPQSVQRLQRLPWPGHAYVTIGEPAHGPAGWRLSHKQAVSVMPIASRGKRSVARYADVALLASVLQDHVLIESLRALYLRPLQAGPSGRASDLLETVRAYLAAGGNTSSAASGLGVSRKTVAARIHTVEELLGRPLEACAADLTVALQLDLLDRASASPNMAK